MNLSVKKKLDRSTERNDETEKNSSSGCDDDEEDDTEEEEDSCDPNDSLLRRYLKKTGNSYVFRREQIFVWTKQILCSQPRLLSKTVSTLVSIMCKGGTSYCITIIKSIK